MLNPSHCIQSGRTRGSPTTSSCPVTRRIFGALPEDIAWGSFPIPMNHARCCVPASTLAPRLPTVLTYLAHCIKLSVWVLAYLYSIDHCSLLIMNRCRIRVASDPKDTQRPTHPDSSFPISRRSLLILQIQLPNHHDQLCWLCYARQEIKPNT